MIDTQGSSHRRSSRQGRGEGGREAGLLVATTTLKCGTWCKPGMESWFACVIIVIVVFVFIVVVIVTRTHTHIQTNTHTGSLRTLVYQDSHRGG